MIESQVIADSISPEGVRIITWQNRYPKFIHGEKMTHRVFSRSASSSRAVPTQVLIAEARSDDLRAVPVRWGKHQAGMQAFQDLEGDDLEKAKLLWRDAALAAADRAEKMAALGAAKQIVNRILEPYTHINSVWTATHLRNFFGLRLHKDADPTMQAIANAMFEAMKSSTPRPIVFGDWHLPYVTKRLYGADLVALAMKDVPLEAQIKVSVARCARVSYKSFETGATPTLEEDLKLYDRLVGAQPIHAGPAEHQATPDKDDQSSYGRRPIWRSPQLHGNFEGWVQYRKMLPGEAIAPLPEGYEWPVLEGFTG